MSGRRPGIPAVPSAWNRRWVKLAVALLARGFYRRVEARGLDLFPESGPVLLAPNHPNSLLDAVVLGSVAPRRIHFVAKHTLFATPLRPILRAIGAIPVRRRQDVAGEEDLANAEAFAACHAVLDRGGVVGIFPEGRTHDLPRLAPLRTGAARIALGAEAPRGFALGVVVLPVGLFFERKAAFRSEALVLFGEPIRVARFREAHAGDPREAARGLTEAIGEGLRALLPDLADEEAGIVEAALGVYADRLPPPPGAPDPASGEADLARAKQVAAALRELRAREPALAARLARRVEGYRRLLAQLRVSDRTLARALSPAALREETLPRAALLLLGLPLALYGLANHVLPIQGIALAERLFNRREDESLLALIRLLGALACLPLAYAVQAAVVLRLAGREAAIGYLVSCPPSGLFAWGYLRRIGRAALTLREGAFLLGHRSLLLRLRRRRASLRRALDGARDRFVAGEEAEEAARPRFAPPGGGR